MSFGKGRFVRRFKNKRKMCTMYISIEEDKEKKGRKKESKKRRCALLFSKILCSVIADR